MVWYRAMYNGDMGQEECRMIAIKRGVARSTHGTILSAGLLARFVTGWPGIVKPVTFGRHVRGADPIKDGLIAMIAGVCRLVPVLVATAVLLSCATAPEEVAVPKNVPPKDEPVSAAREASTACTRSMSQTRRLNGLAFFQAAATCFREERHLEGTFLLIAGQVRSITDLTLLEPKGEADERARAELYGVIRSRAGGPGYDEFYRDRASTQDLFARLEGWSPAFFGGYDPGWSYEPQANPGAYKQMAQRQATFRIAQLRRYAELIRHDDYYAASRELAELRKRNPRGFRVNTPDALRAAELLRVMKRVDRAILTPIPRLEGSDSFLIEPGSGTDFEPLMFG